MLRRIIFLIHNFLKKAPFLRKFTLILLDILLIQISLSLTFYFFLPIEANESRVFSNYLIGFSFQFSFLFLSATIYLLTDQYKSLTRYIDSYSFYKIGIRNIFVTLLLALVSNFFNLSNISNRALLIFWLILTSMESLLRIVLKDFLSFSKNTNKPNNYIKKVAIYGAGEAGTQLYSILKTSRSRRVKVFIDDEKSLSFREIDGIQIKQPIVLDKLIKEIDEILIAMPSLSRSKIKNLARGLQKYNKPIFCVPGLDKISTGELKIDELKSIELEDLLGREPVPINKDSLYSEFKNKSVLITGSGGSIGSEICRQIFDLGIKNIFLLDHNELGLYEINEELKNYKDKKIQIFPILGSATDKNLLNKLFSENKIDFVFHAAAYKHVPLVEINPIEGIYNNVFSTKLICMIAIKFSVKKVILISSDKAVRPTNIMGASKRLAELIIQSYAYKVKNENKENQSTKFSLVRFGNVLGSSGSVVPLFKKQIQNGGPITLTDKNINRYFMTVSEAVQLVLNTTIFSKGGEVFLLDMGKPIKIVDLAKQMIILSGLTIKDSNNKDGDIEIKYTGLRPGEKLFEELLIDANSLPTLHPRIYYAEEKFLIPELLFPQIDLLEKSLLIKDKILTFKIMKNLVKDWENFKVN